MGSGKTLVGALVAERAQAPFFDLDHLVEERAGMTIAEIFATHSEEAFRAFEKQALPGVMRPGAVVSVGGGAVMDDDSWRLVSNEATTVYLEVPFAVLWERIRNELDRPLIARRSESEVAELLERRRPRYEQAQHRVDGSKEAGKVAAEVLKLWSA
jgi:shikimate kinase